ncbi:MAG: NTP transferase domain-containing protein [Bradymonadaceae bacterium]
MSDPGIILAAGAARRFGGPKQLARLGGETLLARVVRSVESAGLAPIVVLGARRARVASELEETCRRVEAEDWSEGMGASIRRAAETVEAPSTDRLVLISCDQPLVTADDLERLYEQCRSADAAAAAYDGVLGVPACFDADQLDRLRQLGGDEGARRLLRGDDLRIRAVPMPAAASDVDTPADLRALRETRPNGGGP